MLVCVIVMLIFFYSFTCISLYICSVVKFPAEELPKYCYTAFDEYVNLVSSMKSDHDNSWYKNFIFIALLESFRNSFQ